jgi:hypothetical protein
MANWHVVRLDVFASAPAEIKEIEMALQEPSQEMVARYAQARNDDPVSLASDIKEIVAFKRTSYLGPLHESENKARRFENSFSCGGGLVWSYLYFVSQDFPKALFLAEYWDEMGHYQGKIVIHAGDEIRCSHDGNQRAQAREWALPNIFAPYLTEYELGLEFGSLWDNWVQDMRKEVARLARRYREAPKDQSRWVESR